MRNRSKVSRASRIAAIAIVAIALASPAFAQDGVNAPITGTAMGSGTVGDSIRNSPASSAPPAATTPQPANKEDSSDDSISVTGGVPGAPPSAPASGAQAEPAVATAPEEASPPPPAMAVAPADAAPPAPAVATAPAEAPPAPPAVAVAPAPAPASAPDVPITGADVAPAAAPSIATTTTTAPAAVVVAPDSAPVTTAATVPAGAIAPPMTLAPVPADVPAPEEATAPASAASAAAAEAVAPRKPPKSAAGAGGTKLASNPPPQGPFGMQFGDSKAPIYIKSDSMSLDYQNHSVLWIGNVHANQAEAQLTSDQLRVNYFDKDFKQMKDMVADGNVRLSQGTRWATGKHGVMDQVKRTVVLTGSPVAHEGNDQITGCKITVFLQTNQSVVDCAHAVLFPHSEQPSGATPGSAAEH